MTLADEDGNLLLVGGLPGQGNVDKLQGWLKFSRDFEAEV